MTTLLRNTFTCLALLGGVFLAGCKVGPVELSGLVVQVDGIRGFETRGGQTEVTVTMRCHNETIRPIGIRSMDLSLALNGIKLGSTTTTRPLATQALSSNTLDVVFTVSDSGVADRLKEALRTGSLNYELQSRLDVLAGDNEMRGKSTSTGSIQVNPHLLNLDD